MSRCIKPVNTTKELEDVLNNHCLSEFRKGFVEIGNENFFLPVYYTDYAQKIENFAVKNNDVLVSTHPKAGTTWTQEMVWLIENDFNYEAAQSPLGLRSPFLELCVLYDWQKIHNSAFGNNISSMATESINIINNLKSPRIIKTHLSYDLLPKDIVNGTKTPKIIHVIRNPKDVCVSFYNHYIILDGYTGSFEDFFKLFINGKIIYGPFWATVLSFWKRRADPNVLVIFYEDMIKDLKSVIHKVAQFLNKPITNEQTEKLFQHLSFDTMKHNKYVNFEEISEFTKTVNNIRSERKFMRSGGAQSYKELLTPEMEAEMNKWIETNTDETGFSFYL